MEQNVLPIGICWIEPQFETGGILSNATMCRESIFQRLAANRATFVEYEGCFDTIKKVGTCWIRRITNSTVKTEVIADDTSTIGPDLVAVRVSIGVKI